MGLRSRLFAHFYERSMAETERAGLAAMRAELLADARGDVVEIGTGTGLNLAHYPTDLRSLVLTEPDPAMLRRLEPHVAAAPVAAQVTASPAHSMPVEDASVDTVVSTLVLCGVPDQAAALGEIRRVLRPGGRLLLIEHVRADDAETSRRQDRADRWQRLVTGCHCNRATGDAVRTAGFDTDALRSAGLPKAPAYVRPLIVGTATPPPA